MSFNQTAFYESLEQLGDNPNPETFFYDFLALIGTSKTTINELKQGINPMNGTGLSGLARRSSIYFEQNDSLNEMTDFYALLDSIKANLAIKKNKIRIIFLTNFKQILAYDTKLDDTLALEYFNELNSDFPFFLPLVGIERSQTYTEHPADVKASEKMGRLFDQIRKHNQFTNNQDDIHALNLFYHACCFVFLRTIQGFLTKTALPRP